MRKIACALLGVLLMTACTPVPLEKPQEEPVQPDNDSAAIEDIGTFPTDNLLDTSDWLTYRNEEWGFEVRYPSGWTIEERKEIPYIHAYSTGNKEGILFLPQGELDRGLHSLSKREEQIILGNKDAKKVTWENPETDEKVICWYQFPFAPTANWITPDEEGKNGNRVEVSCNHSPVLDLILDTLRFF